MESDKILKNTFLYKIHGLESDFQKVWDIWRVKGLPNLATILLHKTLEMEDRYSSYGSETFYRTLTGSLWTELSLTLCQEYLNQFQAIEAKKGIFKKFSRLKGRIQELANYLERCDAFLSENAIDYRTLMAELVSEYLILLQEGNDDKTDDILEQVVFELTVLQDEDFAKSTVELCEEFMEDSMNSVVKTKKYGK